MMTEQIQEKKKKKVTKAQRRRASKVIIATFKKLGIDAEEKTPSKELIAALDSLLIDFGKLQSKVDRVFEIGNKEGYNDMMIGDFVREKMKGEYSAMTINRVLPDTAKHMEKSHENAGRKPKSDNKMLSNEPETNDTKPQEPQGQESAKQAPKPEVSQTDPNRTFKETIAAKNKIIKQQQEEIEGLRTELATAHKEIAALKKELKNKQ